MRRLLIAVAFVAAACGDSLAPGLAEPDSEGRIPFVMLDPDGPPALPRDAFELGQARMEGDFLVMDIRFGGGCDRHEFLLAGSGAIMESMPPQTNVVLAHDANGDPCRALLSRTLRADLTPLRAAVQSGGMAHGSIIVHVAGAQVTYTF